VLFDSPLIGLSGRVAQEVDLDCELVTMLDRYVFPNRPTPTNPSPGKNISLERNKAEVRRRFESLSPSQRKVFWLAIAGKSSRTIAEELGVTVNTIKTHRALIFQKMGVKSILELESKAILLS
jgi:DNA-binding CsgD family transcriptional regulator